MIDISISKVSTYIDAKTYGITVLWKELTKTAIAPANVKQFNYNPYNLNLIVSVSKTHLHGAKKLGNFN